MIRAKLLSSQGQYQTGDEALIALWREQESSTLWLDLEGELTADRQELLAALNCDRLAVADCVRTRHPPKVEEFDHDTFILFRGMTSLDDDLELQPMPVGMWVSKRLLITTHPGTAISVNHFWDHEEQELLLKTPNVLALRILHYVGGRYLEKLMDFEDTLAGLEDALLTDQTDTVMKELVVYRSRLRKLLRIFNYHEALAEHILHSGTSHLGSGKDKSHHVRRDLFDRCERLQTLCSMYYEICGDLVESHISISSHQLNQTMKILTIITAIFVPLGFIAGLYGMNFQYMPELQFRYGYFVILGLMAVLAVGMLTLFRRVRWL
ncbi:MAG: magnesium transporter CorA family protein [Halieaceae bacterium]|jgi:magnesium transporter|uniref:magnesium transporter CorA family protein n=1 Tax=Haliea alexandrii TaxID=2448162 RepID=UPI000F0B8D90|nr:magnesium transporter CorA family protein [Haliea alexandrii]MCR9184987.1 magnesium transporter CorA family protein [Halieaceae bacterium]